MIQSSRRHFYLASINRDNLGARASTPFADFDRECWSENRWAHHSPLHHVEKKIFAIVTPRYAWLGRVDTDTSVCAGSVAGSVARGSGHPVGKVNFVHKDSVNQNSKKPRSRNHNNYHCIQSWFIYIFMFASSVNLWPLRKSISQIVRARISVEVLHDRCVRVPPGRWRRRWYKYITWG